MNGGRHRASGATRGHVRPKDTLLMNDLEIFMTETYDEGMVTEVIRPAAVLPESAARAVLVELAMRDVHGHGVWHAQPTLWRRYERPWNGKDGGPGDSELLGT